jgi:hypothetical protein
MAHIAHGVPDLVPDVKLHRVSRTYSLVHTANLNLILNLILNILMRVFIFILLCYSIILCCSVLFCCSILFVLFSSIDLFYSYSYSWSIPSRSRTKRLIHIHIHKTEKICKAAVTPCTPTASSPRSVHRATSSLWPNGSSKRAYVTPILRTLSIVKCLTLQQSRLAPWSAIACKHG